jgi:hypothetical protein
VNSKRAVRERGGLLNSPDTLIVWTEPTTNLDIALSFQDGDGCEDIWQFICEVQKHLNNLPSESQLEISAHAQATRTSRYLPRRPRSQPHPCWCRPLHPQERHARLGSPRRWVTYGKPPYGVC